MSATMTQEAKRNSATYKMPEATICMPVLWYLDGHETTSPYAGFVTAVGDRTVDVAVHAPNGGKKQIFGVRHVSDPHATDGELNQQGAWDYTEESKRLRRVEVYVSDLMLEASTKPSV